MIGWLLVSLAAGIMGPSQPDPPANVPHPQPASIAPASAPVMAGATAASSASASQGRTDFTTYKNWLMYRARQARIREATIQAYVPGLQLNSRAMQLDAGQRSTAPPNSTYFAPFAPYRERHVTRSLIQRGQSRYSSHWNNLQQIQARTGVDAAVLMAIYGHETSYGAVTGSFDLLEVLASLAYEGRRRDLFETEFLAALKLLDDGIVARHRLKGSYAGATGFPQFMPTAVLRLRADGDGDGRADIWSNEDDAFASIANYLREAGWKPGVIWGVPVRTPATLNRAAIRSSLRPSRCPRVFQRHSRWLTMREWRALGVTPYGRTLPETELATLIEPDGPGQTAYLLSTNYQSILDYNCSNYYALSVGLLADAIARR